MFRQSLHQHLKFNSILFSGNVCVTMWSRLGIHDVPWLQEVQAFLEGPWDLQVLDHQEVPLVHRHHCLPWLQIMIKKM